MSDDLHTPVLAAEVIALTQPARGETILDGTLGLGGHAALFLDAIGDEGRLIGLDADTRNLALARERFATRGNVTTHHANFRQMADIVPPASVDIVLLDIGISSLHFDDATRGFSFRAEGPLDMRLDSTRGETAADIVNSHSEGELADIFYHFGEIKSARRLAAVIVAARKIRPITTTTAFAALVEEEIGGRVLAQAFQSLRIAVNDELGALTDGLTAALTVLRPSGRLAVISFHSLEDRLVKNFLRDRKRITLEILTKKAVAPTDEEIHHNPRSRSAKLRVARKI